MSSINWTKSRGHILFHKILSKRSHWAVKDEEPCLFYCKDTPNSLGGMRLLCRGKKLEDSSPIKAFKLNMLIKHLISGFFESFIVSKDAPLSPSQFDVNISFSPKS